jgi:hypothetical protein
MGAMPWTLIGRASNETAKTLSLLHYRTRIRLRQLIRDLQDIANQLAASQQRQAIINRIFRQRTAAIRRLAAGLPSLPVVT